MTARNPRLESPPYAVEESLARLGQRLRTARLRHNLTLAEVGKKISAGSPLSATPKRASRRPASLSMRPCFGRSI
jgi:hypothetical protein